MTDFLDIINRNKKIAIAVVVTIIFTIVAGIFVVTKITGNDSSSDGASLDSGYTEEKKAMNTCVNDMLENISAGKGLEASDHCSESAASALGLSYMDSESYRAELLSEIGITEESIYTPTSEALDAMISQAAAEFVVDSKVSSVTNIKKKKDGKITGHIELSITGINDFNSLNYADAVTTANDDLVTYINSDMENLMNSLDSQGRDNMKIALINHSLLKLFSDMTEDIPSIPTTERKYDLTVSVVESKDGKLSTRIDKVATPE